MRNKHNGLEYGNAPSPSLSLSSLHMWLFVHINATGSKVAKVAEHVP